ncbi:MAG: hypothetical protein JJ977_09370 [Kordiimonadaceae bacterium]|nr:hypothetical protein [Kordiimonadaceae bacterium]
MLFVTIIAVLIAVGVLVMMWDELTTGYARTNDYLLTTPLLYAAAAGMALLSSLLPDGDGLLAVIVVLVRAILAFALLVFVWGGTLTLGSLVLRLIAKSPNS